MEREQLALGQAIRSNLECNLPSQILLGTGIKPLGTPCPPGSSLRPGSAQKWIREAAVGAGTKLAAPGPRVSTFLWLHGWVFQPASAPR